MYSGPQVMAAGQEYSGDSQRDPGIQIARPDSPGFVRTHDHIFYQGKWFPLLFALSDYP